MTDEQMDARLRRAGEQWRTAHGLALAAAPEVDGEPLDLLQPRPRIHRAWLLWAAAAVIAALIAGGGFLVANLAGGNGKSTPAPAGASIEGSVWRLVIVTDAAGYNHPVIGTPTLEIKEGRLLASDSCNTLSGEIIVGAATLDLKQVATTAMGCIGVNGATASVVDAVMSDSVGYYVTGNELRLTKQGVGTLVYTSVGSDRSTMSPDELMGRTWTLDSISTQGTDGSASGVGSSVMQNIKLTFDGAGHVTITHRCYVDRGDVRIGASSLDVSNLKLASAIPCPATQTQADEQHYDSVVDGVLTGRSTWSVDQSRLDVTKGPISLRFAR